MIQHTLSERNTWRAFRVFRVIDIILVNATGNECGIVSYVRLGQKEDKLDEIIFESIKHDYPLSSPKMKCYLTSQPADSFAPHSNIHRVHICVKNNTNFDPGFELGNIDSMLSISLDVYNPTDAFVNSEIEYFSRINKEDYSHASNEIHSNLDTFNNFIK